MLHCFSRRTALLLTVLLATPLAAQTTLNADASPRHGTLNVSGAMQAIDFEIMAETELAQENCLGRIAPEAPDAIVDWSGQGALRLWSRSRTDAVMVVQTPSGEVLCNDDTDSVNPAIQIAQAANGRYAVWVGAYSGGGDDLSATLYAGSPEAPLASGENSPLVTFGADLSETLSLNVQGDYAGQALGMPSDCMGSYSVTPSARITGPEPFTLRASGESDLTIAVRTPTGDWLCNDDAFGTDPAVRITASGEHIVWVGAFQAVARTQTQDGTMSATTEEPMSGGEFPGLAPGPSEPFSPAEYVQLDINSLGESLDIGPDDERAETSMDVRGSVANPLSGLACGGLITPEATFTSELLGTGPFTIMATAQNGDLVMALRTAGGQWFCSDDASGLNPAIEVDGAGRVSVWLGTYEMGETITAAVTVHRSPLADIVPQEMGAAMGNQGQYVGSGFDLDAQPQHALVLRNGTAEAEVLAGGRRFSPVMGESCESYLTAAPTATLAASGQTVISATGEPGSDLVLIVRTPDGDWLCNDDASGLDPALSVSGTEDGAYSIWVATIDRLTEPVPARLRAEGVSEGAAEPAE